MFKILSRSNISKESAVVGLSDAKTTVTSAPYSTNFLATTNPSPPLFPFPQITAHFFPTISISSRITRAEAAPAFSINRCVEIPASKVTRFSASLI